jgi:hypothetical protein
MSRAILATGSAHSVSCKAPLITQSVRPAFHRPLKKLFLDLLAVNVSPHRLQSLLKASRREWSASFRYRSSKLFATRHKDESRPETEGGFYHLIRFARQNVRQPRDFA